MEEEQAQDNTDKTGQTGPAADDGEGPTRRSW